MVGFGGRWDWAVVDFAQFFAFLRPHSGRRSPPRYAKKLRRAGVGSAKRFAEGAVAPFVMGFAAIYELTVARAKRTRFT